MKKKIVLILCLAMCVPMVFMNEVFAKDVPETGEVDNGEIFDIRVGEVNTELRDYYIQTDVQEQQRARLASKTARASVVSQAWANWNVTKYFQDDPQWGSNVMQTCGKTIASSGCALTTFTMITSKFYYTDNPGQVNTKVGGYACPLNYDGVGRKYNLNDEQLAWGGQMEATAKSIIRGALANGKPVLVGMTHVSTGNTHFVLAYGYETYSDGGSFHYIFDPEGDNDYGTLEQYMANYYIDRIYTYSSM